MPKVENLTVNQLRNWVRDFPEPYATMARDELARRGEEA